MDATAASSSPSKSNSGTPRSSVDHTASPHFHGLHLRIRSPSNPKSEESPVTSHITDKSTRSQAVREAKLFLLNAIRDDWLYPLPNPESSGGAANRHPIGYELRVEDISDLEEDEVERPKGRFSAMTLNPYQLESPDAVAKRVDEHKRKRWQLVQDELLWNEGLRFWVAQRDAWTHAMAEYPAKARPTSPKPPDQDLFSHTQNTADATKRTAQWPLPASGPVTSLPLVTDLREAVDNSNEQAGPCLPIFPPLLPADNPVRANIKPAAYDHIYSKIVIQQLTPSVPIPLTHMTHALVDGWKADGAWPTQPREPASQYISRTSAVMNIIKMKGTHGLGYHRKKASINEDHGTVKRSIGVVKKALGVADEKDFGIDFDNAERQEDFTRKAEPDEGRPAPG